MLAMVFVCFQSEVIGDRKYLTSRQKTNKARKKKERKETRDTGMEKHRVTMYLILILDICTVSLEELDVEDRVGARRVVV